MLRSHEPGLEARLAPAPVFWRATVDTRKLPFIVGHQNTIQGQSLRRDQQIVGTNQIPAPFELSPEIAEECVHRGLEGQHVKRT